MSLKDHAPTTGMRREPPATVGAASNVRTGSILATVGAYLLVAAVAAGPRVLDLGRFVTEDEGNYWLRRSDYFLRALQSGNYAGTAITDHPGVTTMWLGSGGILLRRWLFEVGILHVETFRVQLALMELPVALVHTVGIIVGFAILRRLLSPPAALLAVLLWAVDPFMVGYSRILHVDALSATFMTVSVLAAALYWHGTRHTGALVLSGIAAGLGFLSKSPALVLIPAVGALALLATWRDAGGLTRYGTMLVRLIGWGVVASLTAVVFWPALWADPAAAFYQLRLGIIGEGTQPHALGGFFLGRVDAAPGALFYPVALALRLTPITLLALLLLPLAWWHAREERTTRRVLAALAVYVILFVVALSLSPKKFNRYLVPVFPALDILAAVSIVWCGSWLGARLQRWWGTKARGLVLRGLAAGVVVAGMLNIWYWHPYALVAYNQLLGGAPAGARMFMAGWGEGLEQVAAWLNEQPDITGVATATTMRTGLQTYLQRGAQAVTPDPGPLPDNAGYVVVYKQQAQMEAIRPPFDQFYGKVAPLLTVNIHGVDYAWVYQAPPAVEEVPATFGDDIRLHGFVQNMPAVPGQGVSFNLVWAPHAPLPPGLMLFAHLLAPDGQRVANIDLPFPGDGYTPNRYSTYVLPLALPPDLAPGSYRLVVGVYELESGQRLPLASPHALDATVDGPDALLVTEVEVE